MWNKSALGKHGFSNSFLSVFIFFCYNMLSVPETRRTQADDQSPLCQRKPYANMFPIGDREGRSWPFHCCLGQQKVVLSLPSVQKLPQQLLPVTQQKYKCITLWCFYLYNENAILKKKVKLHHGFEVYLNLPLVKSSYIETHNLISPCLYRIPPNRKIPPKISGFFWPRTK